jgi:hypothetical protein
MIEYTGDDMSVGLLPELKDGERELVLVVHDECCFNSHEGMSSIWVEKGKTPLRPKGRGRSYMVSEFMCQCHGHMELTEEQFLLMPPGSQLRIAQKTLKPGVNAEGYWTGEHVVAQLKEDAIPIFNILHPGKQALFMFDNSSNHNVFAPDALKCAKLNKSDGGVGLMHSIMRDGYHDGVPMPMHDATGKQYGLQSILTARGMWPAGGMLLPDAMAMVRELPDFKGQLPWIKETVRAAGHEVIFLPKFHCEFNWIERYWGAAKKYTRRNCNYTWEGLIEAVPLGLNSVSIIAMRKFARKSFRYMDAYGEHNGVYMSPEQVEYSVKKYKSHRSVREFITDDDFAEILKI